MSKFLTNIDQVSALRICTIAFRLHVRCRRARRIRRQSGLDSVIGLMLARSRHDYIAPRQVGDPHRFRPRGALASFVFHFYETNNAIQVLGIDSFQGFSATTTEDGRYVVHVSTVGRGTSGRLAQRLAKVFEKYLEAINLGPFCNGNPPPTNGV